ncbi:MAG: alpha/beta hydrolase [Calditrichia bacterium]
MKKLILTILLFLVAWVSLVYPAQIEIRQIFSKVMNKQIPALFILPDSYQRGENRFPVVYLLHGYGGNYRNWADKTSVEELADRYDIIFVCPDGSPDSWYFDSPEDPSSQYETHIAGEVVNFTDETYRTIPKRGGRAITGLSMGGHGALFLAIRHPQVFGAAGSMSGGVDLTYSTKKWNIGLKIGVFEKYPHRWDSLSVVNNIEKFRTARLALIIDCGVDDFFIKANRVLHQRLLEAKVAHEYIERSGRHNWEYWNYAVKFQMLFFREFFNRNN